MKKIFCLFLSLLMVIAIVPAGVLKTNAADTVVIDNAKIDVDVPVNGLELKTSSRIVGYKGKVTYWEGTDDLPFKYTVTWYESGSGTPLAKKQRRLWVNPILFRCCLKQKAIMNFYQALVQQTAI